MLPQNNIGVQANWTSVTYECVGDPVEPSVEVIIQSLDDYLAEHEDNDIWYSFHEFIEDVE